MIRQDGSVPVKYGLTMEMESRHSAIKPLLARLVQKIDSLKSLNLTKYGV